MGGTIRKFTFITWPVHNFNGDDLKTCATEVDDALEISESIEV